jgi:hypothetical protein
MLSGCRMRSGPILTTTSPLLARPTSAWRCTVWQCRARMQYRQSSLSIFAPAEEVIVVGHDGSIEFRGRDGIRSSSIYKVRLVLDTPTLETAVALVGFASAGSSSKTDSYPTVIHGPMLKKDGRQVRPPTRDLRNKADTPAHLVLPTVAHSG